MRKLPIPDPIPLIRVRDALNVKREDMESMLEAMEAAYRYAGAVHDLHTATEDDALNRGTAKLATEALCQMALNELLGAMKSADQMLGRKIVGQE